MNLEISVELTQSPKTRPSTDKLGFGLYFTDHMFIADYTKESGWKNARVVPYQSLSLDPGASVLHYGQAIFEGMKAYRGVDGKIRLFRPEDNWRRMHASAERLCMNMIDLETFMEALKTLVRTDRDWVPTESGTSLYLRPTLIATESFLGVRPSESYTFFVIASPVGAYYGDKVEPVKIWVERKYTRAAPGGVGAAKAAGNYAASLLAATQAKERGFNQVLWLDAAQRHFIEEVGTMNVFFRFENTVVTPALTGTILPGITRDSVIRLLHAKDIRVEERPLSLDEVLDGAKSGRLKEVFGTGTAASVSPVGALGIDGRIVTIGNGDTGEISQMLYQTLNDIQYGKASDPFGWTTEISTEA